MLGLGMAFSHCFALYKSLKSTSFIKLWQKNAFRALGVRTKISVINSICIMV